MSWTQVFTDTLEAAGRTAKYGPRSFGRAHFEGAARHGWLFRELLARRKMRDLVESSDRIKISFMFDIKNTGRFITPGQPRKRTNPQLLSSGAVEFGVQDNDLGWLDQEVIFTSGGGMRAKYTQFVKLIDSKLAHLRACELLTMEESAFVKADPSVMETVLLPTVRKPYSLFAFVNESQGFSATNTQAAQTAALALHDGRFRDASGGALVDNWTSIAGVPGTQARWKNYVREFTHASTTVNGVDANGDNLYDHNGIIAALDDVFEDLGFETPTNEKLRFEDDVWRRQLCLAMKSGLNHYRRVLRAANDTLQMGHNDSGSNIPRVWGVPMRRCQSFEEAAVFPNGDLTGLVTAEAGNPLGGTATDSASHGPRFLFINDSKLRPIFHKQRFMTKIDSYRVQGAEENNVNVYQSYWNWCPTSRQRLGMVRGNLAVRIAA